MKILVLGGRKFLGKHFVIAAQKAGHEIVLFNRGQSNADLFPDLETILGDRDGGIGAIGDRRFDAVVDTCGYVPRIVKQSAEYFADRADYYLFVSSISVYDDFTKLDITEDAPVAKLEDETTEDIKPNYGGLKALCEQAVVDVFGNRAMICRPGLIVGPDDPTNRFTYWGRRIAEGGNVLAPLPKERPVQFVDVRDLAAWMLRMVESKKDGVVQITGPFETLSFGEYLSQLQTTLNPKAQLTWVSEEFLVEQEVTPWMGLPLWIPGNDYAGLECMNLDRAKATGLTIRPLEDTIRDTQTWFQQDGHRLPLEGQAGISSEQETELLSLWEAGTAKG